LASYWSEEIWNHAAVDLDIVFHWVYQRPWVQNGAVLLLHPTQAYLLKQQRVEEDSGLVQASSVITLPSAILPRYPSAYTVEKLWCKDDA